MNVGQLLEHLETRYPLAAALDGDPVGIQLGGPDRPIGSVAVCHEVSASTVDVVVAKGITTLVTYHPLLFAPVVRLLDGPTAEGRALRLVEAHVTLIVIHTALDVARPGTGDAAMDAIGIPVTGAFGAEPDGLPIGRHGDLDEAWTTARLAEHLSERLGVVPRVADAARPIRRVGVLPGSGGGFLADAIGVVDAVVSGDVSHHRAVMARDGGVSVVDVGHSATERGGVEALYAAVRAAVPAAVHLDDDPTPWE